MLYKQAWKEGTRSVILGLQKSHSVTGVCVVLMCHFNRLLLCRKMPGLAIETLTLIFAQIGGTIAIFHCPFKVCPVGQEPCKPNPGQLDTQRRISQSSGARPASQEDKEESTAAVNGRSAVGGDKLMQMNPLHNS